MKTKKSASKTTPWFNGLQLNPVRKGRYRITLRLAFGKLITGFGLFNGKDWDTKTAELIAAAKRFQWKGLTSPST